MTEAARPAVARPSVLSLNINSKSALYAAYLSFLTNGGIFVPTPKPYKIGDEVFMLLQLMDEERPRVVEVVHWAASNGDRSENGDYLYGKKRLREIAQSRAFSSQSPKRPLPMLAGIQLTVLLFLIRSSLTSVILINQDSRA